MDFNPASNIEGKEAWVSQRKRAHPLSIRNGSRKGRVIKKVKDKRQSQERSGNRRTKEWLGYSESMLGRVTGWLQKLNSRE